MPSPPLSIRYGRIVYTWLADRNGYKKLRPAIILTNDREISPDTKLAVVAITTTFPDPAPADCVPIPWHPRGHPVTHLHQRSAAVVSWLSSIEVDDVVGYGGNVPEKTMRLIQAKLAQLDE